MTSFAGRGSSKHFAKLHFFFPVSLVEYSSRIVRIKKVAQTNWCLLQFCNEVNLRPICQFSIRDHWSPRYLIWSLAVLEPHKSMEFFCKEQTNKIQSYSILCGRPPRQIQCICLFRRIIRKVIQYGNIAPKVRHMDCHQHLNFTFVGTHQS